MLVSNPNLAHYVSQTAANRARINLVPRIFIVDFIQLNKVVFIFTILAALYTLHIDSCTVVD